MAESPEEYADRLQAFIDDLDERGNLHKRISKAFGEDARRTARRFAVADLGSDAKFSGWAPPLETRYRYVGDGVTIFSPTRSSAGPWTVAEQGRNQGNASGFSGPGINTRTGVTARTKSGGLRKVRTYNSRRRWNGRTQGKNTASNAVSRIEKQAPRLAERELRELIRKTF